MPESRVDSAATLPSNETKTVKLHVTGMTCRGCVNTVESRLKASAGVVAAHVELEGGVATVEVDPTQVDAAGLEQAVREAGYGLADDSAGSEAGLEADSITSTAPARVNAAQTATARPHHQRHDLCRLRAHDRAERRGGAWRCAR